MRVANPTYDTIFKYLMEDIRIAKGLISRIIEEEIVELIPAPQEETHIKLYLKYSSMGLNHHDYVAIIKKEDGEREKVAIEVQKTYVQPKLDVFRNYIADKYSHPSTIDGKNIHLPLKTIYFIEETFNDRLPSVLKVGRNYYDVLRHIKYEGEEDKFVSLMTHESYFIQNSLIPSDLQNSLTRVLNFFTRMFHIEAPENQQLTKEAKRKIARQLDIPDDVIEEVDDRLFQRMLTRLFGGNSDRAVQLNVELSQKWEDEREREAEETEKALKQKDIEIEVNKKELELKDKELEQKDQKLELKDKELEQNKQVLINSIKAMLKSGMSIDQVRGITNLSKQEIENYSS